MYFKVGNINVRLIAVTLIATLLFSGCAQKEQQLPKLWFYTYSSSASSGKTSKLSPTSFLNLQKDGNYTRDFNSYDYGTWKLVNNAIELTNYQQQKELLPVNYFSDNEIKIGQTNAAIDNFEASPGAFKDEKENPFSRENNWWRIPAKAKESDAQIKGRLLNHLKFWELYFTWAHDYNLRTVDVRSTPTLIRIYGNGFSLKSFEALPVVWKGYFFDEEDCRKANEMVQYVFEHDNIAWPHTENKYKMFISAFQQLRGKLGR